MCVSPVKRNWRGRDQQGGQRDIWTSALGVTTADLLDSASLEEAVSCRVSSLIGGFAWLRCERIASLAVDISCALECGGGPGLNTAKKRQAVVEGGLKRR